MFHNVATGESGAKDGVVVNESKRAIVEDRQTYDREQHVRARTVGTRKGS